MPPGPGIVTGYTAGKMDEILSQVIKAVAIDTNGHLIVTTYNDTNYDLGLVKGDKGDTGDQGPPGTAGVWYKDITPQAQTLDTPGTYKGVGTIVIPTATFARKVVLWSQVSFVALSTVANSVYRAAIRDNTSGTPDTVSHLPWFCTANGLSGNISLTTEPLDIPANQGKTFVHHVRRDDGATISGGGGNTDGDAKITKFLALVTAA